MYWYTGSVTVYVDYGDGTFVSLGSVSTPKAAVVQVPVSADVTRIRVVRGTDQWGGDGYFYFQPSTGSGTTTTTSGSTSGTSTSGSTSTQTATAYQYWRINITANNGDPNYDSLKEVVFKSTVGGASINSQVSSSSQSSYWSDPFSYALASQTWYSSSSGPVQWVSVDFGSPVSVQEIDMTPQAYSSQQRAPKDFQLPHHLFCP